MYHDLKTLVKPVLAQYGTFKESLFIGGSVTAQFLRKVLRPKSTYRKLFYYLHIFPENPSTLIAITPHNRCEIWIFMTVTRLCKELP